MSEWCHLSSIVIHTMRARVCVITHYHSHPIITCMWYRINSIIIEYCIFFGRICQLNRIDIIIPLDHRLLNDGCRLHKITPKCPFYVPFKCFVCEPCRLYFVALPRFAQCFFMSALCLLIGYIGQSRTCFFFIRIAREYTRTGNFIESLCNPCASQLNLTPGTECLLIFCHIIVGHSINFRSYPNISIRHLHTHTLTQRHTHKLHELGHRLPQSVSRSVAKSYANCRTHMKREKTPRRQEAKQTKKNLSRRMFKCIYWRDNISLNGRIFGVRSP